MKQATVLIVSDNSMFARDLVGRWQQERHVPSFTMVTSDLWRSTGSAPCDLAVVGPLPAEKVESGVRAFDAARIDTIAVLEDQEGLASWRRVLPYVAVVKNTPDWPEVVVLLGAEILRRVEASSRAKLADHAMSLVMRQAALGKYMLESRHSFNNALTSVLGNAELMMMEPVSLPDHMKEQVDTIHTMALRLHEMMQRFSSLEKEMTCIERESHAETNGRAQAYISGT